MATVSVVSLPLSQAEADENNEVLLLLTWLQENIPLAFEAICVWAVTQSLPRGIFSEACREYGSQMKKGAPNIRALARVATKRIQETTPGVYAFDPTPFVVQ
jgi:hypothetical protein